MVQELRKPMETLLAKVTLADGERIEEATVEGANLTPGNALVLVVGGRPKVFYNAAAWSKAEFSEGLTMVKGG